MHVPQTLCSSYLLCLHVSLPNVSEDDNSSSWITKDTMKMRGDYSEFLWRCSNKESEVLPLVSYYWNKDLMFLSYVVKLE